MNLGQHIRQTYRELQQRWTELADSSFGRAVPAARDDMARGEFISAFISERGLSFPRAGDQRRQG